MSLGRCRYCGERLTIPIGNHLLTCPKLKDLCKVEVLDDSGDRRISYIPKSHIEEGVKKCFEEYGDIFRRLADS